MSGTEDNDWQKTHIFDPTVTMYGVTPHPIPSPIVPNVPYVPYPVTSTGTTVTIKSVDTEKVNRLKQLASEMLGAGEALVSQNKKRVGQLMIKYARKLMQELEDG